MRYSGFLGKKRPYRKPPGSLASAETHKAFVHNQVEETLAVSTALFAFHNVEPWDWRGLAVALARTHVPALSAERAKRGPSLIWDELTRGLLRIEVDDYINSRGGDVSITNACRIVARRKHWSERLRGGKNPVEALRHQYNKAMPAVVRLIRKAKSWEEFAADNPEEAAAIEAMSVEEIGKNS